MRWVLSSLSAVVLLGLGCPASSQSTKPTTTPTTKPAASAPKAAPGPTFTPRAQIKPDRLVWAYLDGKRRAMDIDEARSYGLTIVDLADDWVPYIFWAQTPGKDDHKPNRYMQTYVDLANDRIDVNGARLQKGQHNYHEVYGIPPSLSVLQRRFIEDDKKSCYRKLDLSLLKDEYHGPVRVTNKANSRRLRKRYISAKAQFKKARRKTRGASLEQLLKNKRWQKVALKYQKLRWQYNALVLAHQRMACEGIYGRRVPNVKPGIVTWAVRNALRRFERKHNVYGWGMIFQNTARALGRTPRENNFESLKRAIAERVISAAGIVEDGTRRSRYTGADGKRHQVHNLTKEFGEAAWRGLGLTDADKAWAWIKGKRFDRRFMVALKLPKLPEYYGPQMELKAVIDRGDIWYDLPFDEKTGKRRAQPRTRLPSLTLYTTYRDQKIALVRWRTTIGGWQKEKRGNQEYYKYKISDVGARVWKNIVAGPVWVPPKKTPTTDLVKFRPVLGRSQRVVSQSSFGPGYASAYGLVAAYHVTPRGHRDNQVRTHGTVNYMSVRNGFSHGCHRLYNYRAVRLFSFVLRHRAFERKGQARLGYTHRFEHRGEEFQINLHTRGYFYELKPPMPVMVLEGRIRGKKKKPYEHYVKKPTQLYQEDLPKLQGQKKRGGSSMKQDQTL
ncbi:MAG: hypothetical protein CSA65_06305 [Proteobacteria bacterium]|nr:MAG: hypothetical protein CSA65_06305 [Pseudomonadota bacterium]